MVTPRIIIMKMKVFIVNRSSSINSSYPNNGAHWQLSMRIGAISYASRQWLLNFGQAHIAVGMAAWRREPRTQL